MPRNFSKTLSLLFKIALAAGVIYWMVHSGKLNLRVVGHAFQQQWELALVLLLLLYSQVAIISCRWNILNGALGFGIRYLEAFSLSMIGLLFTVVLPGGVSGDVIKAYYVGTLVPNRRAHAFTTILMDRFLGLLSLLTLGAAGVFYNYRDILQNGVMTTLATFVVMAFAGGCAALVAGIFFSGQVTNLLKHFESRLLQKAAPAGQPDGPMARVRRAMIAVMEHAIKSCQALEGFRAKPWVLVFGILMSLPSHLIACTGMWIAMRMVHAPGMPLARFLLIVPLGLISTVIPLSPGGVGIGQAAFYGLGQALAPGTGEATSNAFTVYQTLQVGVYLSGLISYLSHKSVAAIPEPQEAEVVV